MSYEVRESLGGVAAVMGAIGAIAVGASEKELGSAAFGLEAAALLLIIAGGASLISGLRGARRQQEQLVESADWYYDPKNGIDSSQTF